MKKAFLLSISIPFFLAQIGLAAPVNFKGPKVIPKIDKKIDLNVDPKIAPKITTDVIEGQLKGRPTFKIGDWNSSGAPEMPYEPDYEFSYHCQAQMTDGLLHGESNNSYRFYAVADFRITNEDKYFRTDDLRWFAKKRAISDQIWDSDDSIPFATTGSWIAFNLRRGPVPQDDRIFLSLHLEQKVGPVVVSKSEIGQGVRSSESLSVEVQMEIKSAHQKSVPSMNLKVYCDKEM